jgi:hypothetical protein
MLFDEHEQEVECLGINGNDLTVSPKGSFLGIEAERAELVE